MVDEEHLIEIRNLDVEYWQQVGWRLIIEDLSLFVDPAETFGLVGESGCGKSTTVNAMMGFRPRGARYRRGSVRFNGQDLLRLPEAKLQKLRGASISLVPQDPTTALSPGMRVGRQIVETLKVHQCSESNEEAYERVMQLFRQVSLPTPEKTFKRFSHQLSGGQQQRVIIAMALACDPKLILLDEPTTGLDVTTQAQILDLLVDLRSKFGLAMFYVTHNLGVVAQICNRIGVMYAGRLVEVAPRHEIFLTPKHPYTQGLIVSVPRISTPTREHTPLLKGLLRWDELPPGCPFAPRCDFAVERCLQEKQELTPIGPDHWVSCWRWEEIPTHHERVAARKQQVNAAVREAQVKDEEPILVAEDLEAAYGKERIGFFKQSQRPIVEDISFSIRPGETFAMVGESGSGKTTVARAVSGLMPFVTGELTFEREYDLTVPVNQRRREVLRSVQLVFQHPDASLNPRQRVSQIIGRPLNKFFGLSGKRLRRQVDELLEDVRLDASYYNRFPDELSGGERQRVAIARALAAEPKLLLCDEILSALDVSVQANILELLKELQVKRGLAFLFISHDLAVVRSLAHRVAVMYWGRLCEVGPVEEVFSPPYHPYTYLLLSSVPEADPNQVMPPARKDIGLLTDEVKTACPFAPRCPWKVGSICEEVVPPWRFSSGTHSLRCHIPLEELQEHDVWKDRFVAQRDR